MDATHSLERTKNQSLASWLLVASVILFVSLFAGLLLLPAPTGELLDHDIGRAFDIVLLACLLAFVGGLAENDHGRRPWWIFVGLLEFILALMILGAYL